MKMHLTETLCDLLKQQDFDDVSVRQICENAGIARSTFYYHFNDKYDVVQWHFDYIAERNLFEVGRTLTWRQADYRNTREVMRFKDLYTGAFAARGYQSIFSYSKRRRVETLRETLEDYKRVKLDAILEMQVFALAEAEGACMNRWFKQGMPYDIELLTECLVSIVPKRLYDLLNDPVDPEYY